MSTGVSMHVMIDKGLERRSVSFSLTFFCSRDRQACTKQSIRLTSIALLSVNQDFDDDADGGRFQGCGSARLQKLLTEPIVGGLQGQPGETIESAS